MMPRTRLLAPAVLALLASGAALAQTGQSPAAPAAPASPAQSQAAPATPDKGKVVARVDGNAITEGDLAVAAEDPALQIPGVPDAQKRDLLIGYLVDLKLGARAAEAAKIGESADFTRKLAYARD